MKNKFKFDPTQMSIENLVKILIPDPTWQYYVTITKDDEDKWKVYFEFTDHRDGEVERIGLRHSSGPRQHYYWDTYGDDMLSLELAFFALVHAPAPPQLCGVHFTHKFKVLLDNEQELHEEAMSALTR